MTRPQGSLQYDNRGRVVLVTGGANGIGRAICESWLQSGAAVVCMDIDAAAAESLPEGILFVRGNTAERSDCDNAVAFACDSCGGLDVLINNAAIQPRDSYLPQHEYSTELWDRLVAAAQPVTDADTRAAVGRANAALTSFLFLLYFDTRAGYQDTGPYDLGDGRVLMVRDFKIGRAHV